jgi:hypothetical protein
MQESGVKRCRGHPRDKRTKRMKKDEKQKSAYDLVSTLQLMFMKLISVIQSISSTEESQVKRCVGRPRWKTNKKGPIRSWKEYFAAFPNPLPKLKIRRRGRPLKSNIDKQELSVDLILHSTMVI